MRIQTPLTQAIKILNAGGLIGIPTETVYGLAARVDCPSAVSQVFERKKRPKNHPLIVHIGQTSDLSRYARDIPNYVWRLTEKFWPGPLSLVLKKTEAISDEISAGQDSVAIRMPNHPLTLTLLKQLGSALVAPSANLFMQVSPTTAQHVRESLGSDLFVLEGGPCEIGIESTIVDVRNPKEAIILRPGMLSWEQLASVLDPEGVSVRYRELGEEAPKMPGDCPRHYSPKKKVYLLSSQTVLREFSLNFMKEQGREANLYLIALGTFEAKNQIDPNLLTIKEMPLSPEAYAQVLYRALREGDDSNREIIVIESPPKTAQWRGIWDRIERSISRNEI